MRPPEPELAAILTSGLRAPSAENRHYLEFAKVPDGVELSTTDRATWAAQPHREMLALLSYGAVLENIELTSAARGWRLVPSIARDPDRPALIARLDWEPASEPAPAGSLADAIDARHTNRRFYARTRLPDAALQAMAGAASDVPGATLRWLDGRPFRAQALQAVRLAEAERFVGRHLHQELFGSVRFDRGWSGATDEWLAPAALEVEAPMRPMFGLLRHPGVMRAARLAGGHHFLGLRAGYLPAASAPHLGLIVASGSDDRGATLAAGRAFQRAWLAATLHGVALQPMAAATVLVRQAAGEGWVRASVRKRLQASLGALTQGLEGEPFMLFRVGRAAAASAVAGRMPLAGFVVERGD